MGEVVLYMKDFEVNSTSYVCRICHENEFEGCKSIESPCACSGTVKFAHRDCIQRWCDEKGNTTCEICLQKFEPGYTALSRKSELDNTVVTIRDESSDVRRRERWVRNRARLEADYLEYCSTADRSAKCCKKITFIITVLLLLRHAIEIFAFGTEDVPFSLTTLLLLRASGIILPMYAIVRAITAVQNSMKRLHQEYVDASDSDYEGIGEE